MAVCVSVRVTAWVRVAVCVTVDVPGCGGGTTAVWPADGLEAADVDAADRDGKPVKVGDRDGLTPADPHDASNATTAASAASFPSRARRGTATRFTDVVTS